MDKATDSKVTVALGLYVLVRGTTDRVWRGADESGHVWCRGHVAVGQMHTNHHTTKALVNHNSRLEYDSLSNWKPMNVLNYWYD